MTADPLALLGAQTAGAQAPAVPDLASFESSALDALARSLAAQLPMAPHPAPSNVTGLGSVPVPSGITGLAAAPTPSALQASLPAPPQVPGVTGLASSPLPSGVRSLAPSASVPGVGALASGPLPAMPAFVPGAYDPRSGGLPPLFTDGAPLCGGPGLADALSSQTYYFLGANPGPVPASARRASAPSWSAAHRPFDVHSIRRDFPILEERIHGKPLVWLDNAATTQKPRAVIDRIAHYYAHENSNVHRGAHTLAARSTDAYENARQELQRFLGAASPNEIVFVRGTTEAINLVANTYGSEHVGEGDEIVLSQLEHHSNIVPWQTLARGAGAKLRVIPVNDRGEIVLAEYERLLGARTKIVAISQVSNALGTVLPVAEMIAAAHRHGAVVLIDGAQGAAHLPVDVKALDADFYVLSGHKIFGPTGVGVLYGKQALLEGMRPWQGGGNMIQHVTFDQSTFAAPPARFEAGTATLAPAVGLGAAVAYLQSIGMPNIARYEHELLEHATAELSRIPGIQRIGTAVHKASVLSFLVDGIEVSDMGRLLDREGIAVRAGHHCAQPTMQRFGLTGTVRASLALYNTHEEVEHLARVLRRLVRA
jgi:cysteine desulfurase / selenocysteine lyase